MNTVRVCDSCGSRHIRIITWVDAIGKEFCFCSMACKSNFITVQYPEMMKKEKEREEQNASVLPEMRTLIARKTKNGITVVRRDRQICRGSVEGEGQRSGSDSSRREK